MRPVGPTLLVLCATLACFSQEQARPPATKPSAKPRAAPPSTANESIEFVPVPPPTSSNSESARSSPADDSPAERLVILADSAGHPTFPIILHNICEGEDCDPTPTGVVCLPLELHATEDDTSAIVTRLAAGDTMSVSDVNYHMTRLGLVVLRRDTTFSTARPGEDGARDAIRYLRGDTLYLIRYYELGDWQWWYRGKTQSGMEFWTGPAERGLGGAAGHQPDAASAAIALSHPEADVWHRIVPRTGRPGWLSPRSKGMYVETPGYDGWNCAAALGARGRKR